MANPDSAGLKALIQYAKRSGATGAAVISTADIVVEEALAAMCREPRCPSYGLSKRCPPHVSGPSGFRKKLENFTRALVFKIDVPSEILLSSERLEIFQLLHEIAAGVEQSAVRMGFENARAYTGGSCKEIFCGDFAECAVLSGEGNCRNPQSARPSMSGFGINVSKLMEAAGWTMSIAACDDGSNRSKMGNVCGLVLIF